MQTSGMALAFCPSRCLPSRSPSAILTGLRVSLALPQAIGGEGQVTYALSPELPAGLTFDAGPRVLSGTPPKAADEAAYALIATDREGTESAADDDTATLLFSLAVVEFEAVPVTVSIAAEASATNAAEGGEAVFTVSVPAGSEPSADLTVSWTVAADWRRIIEDEKEDACYFGDSGASGDAEAYDFASERDGEPYYRYPSGTVTIAANTATATVRISIFQDLDGEGVEIYLVTLSDPQPGSGDRAIYTVGASASGSIAASDFKVELWNAVSDWWEGGTRTYRVVTCPAPSSDLVVNWAITGEAGIAPSDFGNSSNTAPLTALPSGQVTIPAFKPMR